MKEILLADDDGDSQVDVTDGPGPRLSGSALAVAQAATRFQIEASAGRLTTKTGIRELETNFKNLTKANAVKAERKAKREFELKHKETGIKVGASLWSLDDNGKMSQVSPTQPAFPTSNLSSCGDGTQANIFECH